MKTETLTCNSCGAPLEVPDTANFVTCNHCSSQLAIRRSENATFTEQLDRLAEKTEQLSSRVDNLSNQNEVAALDREWELERENYMVVAKHGQKHIPTQAASIGGGVIITVFGCFWIAMAIGITSFAPGGGIFSLVKVGFPLFGVVFVIFGIKNSISGYQKAGRYQQAERRYRQRRSELQNKL